MTEQDDTPVDGIEGEKAADQFLDAIHSQARVVDAEQLRDKKYRAVSKDSLRNMILELIGPFVGADIRELLGDIAQFQLKLPGLTDENQRLEQEILELNEQIGALEAEHDRLKLQLAEISGQIETDLAEIEARVPEVLAEIERLESDWNRTDREAEELRARIAELEDRLKILQTITDVADPQARIRELEEIVEDLTRQRHELLLAADYFDAGDLYGPGVVEGIADDLRKRVSGLARSTPEGQAGAETLGQVVDSAEAQIRAVTGKIDRLVEEMNRGEGSVFLMAELVRLGTEMRILRDRLHLTDESLQAVEAASDQA